MIPTAATMPAGERLREVDGSVRPKVLHVFKVALPEQRGGIIEVMHAIAEGLAEAFDATILTASNLPQSFFSGHGGVPVFTAPHLGNLLSMPLSPTLPVQLARMASRFDLVALHSPFPLADLAGLTGAWNRTKLVVHWHSEIVRQAVLRPFYRHLMRHTLNQAKRVIVSGPSFVEGSEFLQPVAEKCSVVPFGTEIERWTDLGAEDHREIAVLRAEQPRLVLAVGRLVSYKGFDVLLEAVRDVDCTLAIVGVGVLRESLVEKARCLGIADRVRFLGKKPDGELRRLYHAAKVLAFPSVSAAETFGIVQIEAMACGLPVVNTALPTEVPRVARNNMEGLTVPPSDPRSLAAALRQVLDSPETQARFSRAAVARARNDFPMQGFLDGVKREYRSALQS